MGLVRTVFRIGLPVVSVMALAAYYGQGDERATAAIIANIGLLGVMLFGLYIMVSGLFRR